MVGRLRIVPILAIVALAAPTIAQAQEAQGRVRVLIPYFQPMEGARDDFGKDASKELREMMAELPAFEALDEKQIKDELKRFKMKIEELNCTTTRQLASQIGVPIAVCADYTQQGEQTTLNAQFHAVNANEQFDLETITVGGRDSEEDAARQMVEQFARYDEQTRMAAICQDYYNSQLWDDALRACEQAIELNDKAVSVRFLRARVLYETERYPEALAELERVLELNNFHEDALQTAGYVATVSGDPDAGRAYYQRYLDINPGNASIRMNIAYRLAQAGDPVGAMDFIQVGLDVDPENIDLWEQYGGFAFTAAARAEQAAAVGAENAGGVPPEAREYYQRAIDAYERVFAAKGNETPVGHLQRIVNARVQLGQYAEAIATAEQALQAHAQEDVLWYAYADALQRGGRLDEAITALDRVREINPDHPSAALRQGNWLIQAGRIEDAVALLRSAVAGNAQQAEQAARLILADAFAKGYQAKNYAYGVTGFSAAKELPGLPENTMRQLHFWHGYCLYQVAVAQSEPNTLETARNTLPKFQQALQLFQQSGNYAREVNLDPAQMIGNTNTYIEIQEAIIRRGR